MQAFVIAGFNYLAVAGAVFYVSDRLLNVCSWTLIAKARQNSKCHTATMVTSVCSVGWPRSCLPDIVTNIRPMQTAS